MRSSMLFLCAFLVSAAAFPLAPPCCYLGDTNTDGTFNKSDMFNVNCYLNATCTLTAEQLFNGDVDGDGSVTTADKDLMFDYITGAIDTYPRCGDIDEDGELEYGDISDPTSDAYILNRHILNIEFITDPVTLSNCDANDSGVITTYDEVLFTELYYGERTGFASCTY